MARRCAGFSRPQLEPGGQSPEEAHILAGILPKLSDLGQGAIGEAIEAAGAGQVGRLHKGALDDDSIYPFAFVPPMPQGQGSGKNAPNARLGVSARVPTLRAELFQRNLATSEI